jgi:hypothetical protein
VIETKYLVVGGLVLGLGAFALGRYTTPDRVEIRKEIVTVEVERKEVKEKTDVKLNQKTVVEETIKPDGTIVKKTTIDTDQSTNTNTDMVTETKKNTTNTEVKIVDNGRKINLAAIAGPNFTNFGSPIAYGATVSRQFLGPVTLGIWGLSTGYGGVSLGLQF